MAARNWTPEQRAEQAKWIRQHKPWELSTGAKTSKGKRKVARNGFKHGCNIRMTRDEYIGLIRKMNPSIADDPELLGPFLAKMTFYDESPAREDNLKPIIRLLTQAQSILKKSKHTVLTIKDVESARTHIKPMIKELCSVSTKVMDTCDLLMTLGRLLEDETKDREPFKSTKLVEKVLEQLQKQP